MDRDETVHKRRRTDDYVHRIACRDLYNGADAAAMVEALAWVCETLVMCEAVRFILCYGSERSRVHGKRNVLVERWWKVYCTLPTVAARSDAQGKRRARFAAVVRAYVGDDDEHCRVVWTGLPGVACKDANCDSSTCDGNHMGLGVCSMRADAANVVVGHQMGIAFYPSDLEAWALRCTAGARGKGAITAQRAERICRYIDGVDNVVRHGDGRSVYMVGLWGLVQHSCVAATGICFAVGSEERCIDSHGHKTAVRFAELHDIACTCGTEDGRLAWNYGGSFEATLRDGGGCRCAGCRP